MIRLWRFFGVPAAERDDGTSLVVTAQAARLFAALVVDAPQPTSPGRLAERVADPTAGDARAAARVAVSRCRSTFGKDHILTASGGYAFDAERASVDLWRYDDLLATADDVRRSPSERLADVERALPLRLGSPFATVEDAPWLADLVAHYDERHRRAEELWGRLKISVGQHESLAPALQQLVRAEPMREQRWELLMEALARSGRRTEALEVFDRLASMLAAEIGAVPSAAVQALAERIDRDDVDVCRPFAEPMRLSALPAVATLIGADELVDRAVELAGRHRVVSIVGLGGLGKTQIAVAAAARLGRPTAFVDVGVADDVHAVRDRVAGAVGVQPSPDPELTIAGIVEQLRHRDVLLVIDACERVASGVAAVVGAVLAPCPGIGALLTSRVPVPVDGAVELRPAPLTLGTAKRPGPGAVLLADHAGIAVRDLRDRWGAVAEAHERAGGLPLALIMLGRSWAVAPDDPAPHLTVTGDASSVDDVARGMLDHLAPGTRGPLTSMAWLPDGFAARQLAAVGDRGLDDALFDLRVARSLGLVQVRPSGEQPPGETTWYRFPDPVREALASTRSADETNDFVERYVEIMSAELLRVRPRFTGRFWAAAAEELSVHGTNVAAAVRSCPDPDRAVELGAAMVACWSAVGSSAPARQLLASLDELDGVGDRGRALLALMRGSIVGSFAQRALYLSDLEDGRRYAAACGDRDLELRLMSEVVIGRGWSGDVIGARQLLDEMHDEAKSAPDPWTWVQYCTFVALGDALAGRLQQGLDALIELAERFGELGDGDSATSTLAMAGIFLRRMGELDRAERILRRAVDQHAPTVLNRHGLANAIYELALVAKARSQPDAIARLTHAVELLDRYGEHRTAAVAHRDLGAQLLAQGDLEVSVGHLQRSLPVLLRVDVQASAAALAMLAAAASRCGQAQVAAQLVGAANDRRARPGGLPLSADESALFEGWPTESLAIDDVRLLELVATVGPRR